MTGGAVDAHQHVWDPATAAYPWLTPDLSVLDRRYGVADVAADLAAAGITRTVLVQAADDVEDTANMFREAAAHPVVGGVVVWLPLHDAAASEALLDAWGDRPVVGARHLVHRDPDPDWLLRDDVAQGLALLARRGLAFDVCAETPYLLGHVPALAAAQPDLRLVVDHLGKPPVASGGWQPWADLLARAAHGRPLASVQDTELDTSRIRDAAHEPVQRIDLADEVALADAANGRVAG